MKRDKFQGKPSYPVHTSVSLQPKPSNAMSFDAPIWPCAMVNFKTIAMVFYFPTFDMAGHANRGLAWA